VAQVVGLSLQIFAALMEGFKDHLKSELEVFVATIFLRILESENSTYDHKLRVLEVFHGICKDPSVQVEMFINYDCEMDSIDLFRRIVDGFAKIAKVIPKQIAVGFLLVSSYSFSSFLIYFSLTINKNPVLSHARGNTDFMSSSSKRLGTEEQNIRLMGLKGVTIVLESLMRSSGLWQGLSNDPESDQPPLPTALDRAIASGSLTALDVSVSGRHPDIPSDQDNGANAAAPTGDLATTASSTKNSSVVNVFDRKQKVQEEVETGILKFNLSPKKGLQYLASLGHVEMTPKGVATFLLTYQDRLDKTSIGDYLGREREYENGFCLKVLHEYVDSMDFENMAFDLAIRYFLSGFRLPGEAQKIDRLMEKFAERYYLQNRDTFASADMAFILAFSTIMLQTNLHNPAIRDDKRMTKEQFLKQNKGISADGELSDDLLSEIYDRIAAAPISITEDEKLARKVKKEEPASFTVFQVSNDKRRKDAFNHERKEMVRTGEAMFRQALKKGTVFVRNTTRNEEACSKPMFEVVWPPMIGVLSQLLELADEPQLMEQCLLGFHYMIRLACRLDFPTARHALCNALAKFTTLETVREMHRKNVECTKLLLQIARTEADYLEENWTQVLQCVSQLARLQLFANRLHTDDVFFSDTSSHSQAERSRHGRPGSSAAGSGFGGFHWQSSGEKPPSAMDPFTKLFAGPSRADTVRQIEENNAELLMREIDPQLVDQIFLGSSSLNSESVYFFVKSLCEVSALEISVSSSMNSLRGKDSSVDTANPRIFSLQKLVEVADANMQCRSRYAWGKIWSLLANHFTVVGTQDNFALAMFAIDSLKQLSTKFLQKQELSNFNFQRVFLKPFEVIISKSKSHEIKDLVLRCIDVLLRTSSANIRSGWRSIFAIFEVAAAQDATEVATIAFEITQRLLMSQFQLLIYDFVELVNCLVTFVSSTHTSLSVKALGLLSVCADHLASGALGPALEGHPNHPDQQTSASPIDTNGEHPNKGGVEVDGKIDEDASVFRLWWPLLFGLSSHVADVRPQVRERSLSILSKVLRLYGGMFSQQTWGVLFKGILFPMIDSAKTDIEDQRGSYHPSENPVPSPGSSSWTSHIGKEVFTVCLDMFKIVRSVIGMNVQLLSDFLSMLEGCICQDSEALGRLGLMTLVALVEFLGEENSFFDSAVADLVCAKVSQCALRNLCVDFGASGTLRVATTGDFDWYENERKEFELLGLLRLPASNIGRCLTECPIAARRNAKVWSNDISNQPGGSTGALRAKKLRGQPSFDEIGTTVRTPYGDGTVNEVNRKKKLIETN
jgi:brefeldin A-inhibited guanine nucleotide-exchange protein